jgi:uncharacterized repeat protein (TIGR01451 family)
MHGWKRFGASQLTRLVLLSLIAAVLAGPLPGAPGAPAAPVAEAATAAKIERSVWKSLAEAPDGMAEAIIYLEAQADLEFAYDIADWDARGWAVYNTLRQTAERSQPAVLGTLAAQRAAGHVAEYRSFWVVNVITVRADRAALLAVAALPDVAQVLHPFRIERPGPLPGSGSDSVLTVEWGIEKIRADEVWATYGVTGTGAVVANVDTGVQYDHPALVSQYRGNLGGGNFDHNYNWWDLYGTLVPNDGNSHGTHTMGTMIGDDGTGNQIGVAPGAKWIATLGCCPDNEALLSSEQWIIAPTRLDGTAPDPSKRPDVSNNSWGGYGGSLIFDKLNAAQRAAGVLPVYSAGNSGSACATLGAPGDNPAPYNIGATDISDNIAGFSSRGPHPFDEDPGPEVSAPGVNVRSSVPPDGYSNFSGTSMAAPHTSGAVALLISLEPKLRGQLDQIEELLRKTAVPRTSGQTCGGVPGSQVPNNTFGWGRIDVKAAADIIRQAGWLSGTVTAGANPVANAVVAYSRQGYTGTLTTRTDGAGRYSVLAGQGTWDMTVTAYGHQPMTVNGVAVTENVVTTQNFNLTALPVYTVSGTVRDASSSAPVAAYLQLSPRDSRPAWAGAGGTYSMTVPQGVYSITVSHPGYSPLVANLAVSGNMTYDPQLSAQINYTCVDSRDPGGPVYYWLEASDGNPHPLGDDSTFSLTMPGTFTYFGVDYTLLRVSSNGFVTFGPAYATPKMIFPFEGQPNADINGLAEDLNPASGAQGTVYDKIVGTQVILQWQDVEHWQQGYPETFQIILDTADDSIIVQYKDLSWPQFTSGGLENANGTVGQLWSFMDSALLAGNLAVRYTSATGNAVNWGCDHALWLTHNPNAPVVSPGGQVTYRLAGNAIGQYGAPGAVLTATVPAGTTFVAASPGGVLNGSVVTWSLGNLRAKAEPEAWFRVSVPGGTPFGTRLVSEAVLSDASGQSRPDTAIVVVAPVGATPTPGPSSTPQPTATPLATRTPLPTQPTHTPTVAVTPTNTPEPQQPTLFLPAVFNNAGQP